MKPHEEMDLCFERLLFESDQDENETEEPCLALTPIFSMLTKGVFQNPKKINLIP